MKTRKKFKYIKITAIIAIFAILISCMYISQNIQISKLSDGKKLNASNYYTGYNNKTNVTKTEKDYTIPNLSGEDIIVEASKYSSVKTWDQGASAYNDYWSPYVSIEDKTAENKVEGTCQWLGYDIKKSDCSGYVYSVLRHLGIRLTNFYDGTLGGGYDGRFGPIPMTPPAWVHRDNNDINGHMPYHITWINGQEIAKITDYEVTKKYNEQTKNMETIKSYGTWIEENNITVGTVIVTLNANASGFDHMWFYIGKFDNVDSVKSYLTSIGANIDGLQFSSNGGTNYWSIECNGSDGVIVTNRDPAESNKEKGGNGYAGFSLFDIKEGSYHLNLVKKDLDDDQSSVSDSNGYGEALSGAEFTIKQYINTTPDSTKKSADGEDYANWTNIVKPFVTDPNGKNAQTVQFGGESQVNIDDTKNCDYYRITETKAPDGYTKRGGTIQLAVHKKQNGNKYELEKVVVTWGKNKAEITPGGQAAVIQMKDDGSTTNDKDAHKSDKGYYLAVDMSTTAITVTWRDPKITKNPKVKVVKKNMEGTDLPDNIASTGSVEIKIFDDSGEKSTFSNVPFNEIKDLGELKNGNDYSVYIKETQPPEGYINEIGNIYLAGRIRVENGNLTLKGSIAEWDENCKYPITTATKSEYYEDIKLERRYNGIHNQRSTRRINRRF